MTAPALNQNDPLLESLILFARVYHRPVSREALIAGLPVEPGKLDPELFSTESPKALFSRVAKRAGFTSRLVRTDLNALSDLLLPCILVLRDRKACILDSMDRTTGRARILMPEVGDGEQWVELERLGEEYLGFAFLLKKEYDYQGRSLQLIRAKRRHWFWGTLWRSRDIYASALLASFMINLFVLATPLFTMNVYDRVVPNDATETLWVLAIGIVVIYAFDGLTRFVRSYFLEIAGRKSDVIMSSILFEHALNMRLDQWPRSVGAFANNLREFETLRGFLTSATLSAFIDLPFAIIFLLVIMKIGGWLAVIPIITIVLLVAYGLMLVDPLKESIEETYEASSNKHALLIEHFHAIQTIKALGTHNHAQWEWEEATGEIARRSMRHRNLSSSIGVVTNLLMQLSTVALVVVGVYLIKDQSLTLGGLIAVMMISSRVIAPLGQVTSLIANYEQTRTTFLHLESIMRKEVERPEHKRFVRPPAFDGALALEGMSFTYPGADRASLTNITLRIRSGEHVGIIGKIGSGKTTVAKLLINLYQPTAGAILVDGLDIKQIDPAVLRHHIGYVGQEVELLRGTVRENICYKNPHADDAALLTAARVGGVDLFVNRHPRGYDMEIGEMGLGLSGGQRQSIALARAMLLDPPILIMDEPTASMDNTTELTVKQRLQAFAKEKTLVLITHKGSMLDLVDRLIVLDEGRVVLDGPKAQVLNALRGGENAI